MVHNSHVMKESGLYPFLLSSVQGTSAPTSERLQSTLVLKRGVAEGGSVEDIIRM